MDYDVLSKIGLICCFVVILVDLIASKIEHCKYIQWLITKNIIDSDSL